MNEMTSIRVLLVDDHAVVRSGLAAFLMAYDDLELVGQAASGEEAVRLCDELAPDVVLMDLVMPGMDGATTTRLIRGAHPTVQVVVLTSFPENALIQKALEAGAIGYLIKNAMADDLVDAIRAAKVGRPTLAPEATEALAQAEKLERLARAVIDAPPDASTLPGLLREHVPDIFPHCQIEIRAFPDRVLLHHPADSPAVSERVWEWVRTVREMHCFLPDAVVITPWGERQASDTGLAVAPILGVEDGQPIGGIYMVRRDGLDAPHMPSAVEALAAQIAAALHRAQDYAQTLAQERVAQELALAEEVQASFLPDTPPDVAGWHFAATLEPARETSGDFYDFIPLPGGRLGIVIADVAGKGMGAALYMALCRTLLRTFAFEFEAQPHRVVEAANRRALSDAHANLFATVFYGVLDLVSGTMSYCNAGHNPPLLLRAQPADEVVTLSRTGIVMGAFEDAAWQQATIQIEPGDALLLYTDGVTDAHNQRKEFFGEERMLGIARGSRDCPARDIQAGLIAALFDFMGDTSQFDDVTLMVITRDAAEKMTRSASCPE